VITLLGAVISYVVHYRQGPYYFTTTEKENWGIKLLIPLAIVVTLHKSSELVLTIEQIQQQVKLPFNLISQELKRLQEAQIVTETSNHKYTLLFTEGEIELTTLYSSFLWTEELEAREIFTEPEVQAAYQNLKAKTRSELAELKLKDILKSN
jgi:membrane protein